MPPLRSTSATHRELAVIDEINWDVRKPMHNWHISGPGGVDRKTRVGFTGRKRFTVRLVEGTYRIRCDPHSDTMRTRLVVRRPG